MKQGLSITVVVTRFAETDELVLRCLESLRDQAGCTTEVLFLDQKKSDILSTFCSTNTTETVRFVYQTIPAKSLSYARNSGIKLASSNFVAFCDSDCVLSPNWGEEILRTFTLTGASIVGTKIVPLWESTPSWYHKSRIIREFYSVIDISKERVQIGKVVGASFALDKNKCGDECFFDEKLGRKNGVLLGGEETDLCERVIRRGGAVIYTPHTFANHIIAPTRIRVSWILKRAYFGGMSRAIRKGAIRPFNTERVLIDYLATALILPFYSWGYLVGMLKDGKGH